MHDLLGTFKMAAHKLRLLVIHCDIPYEVVVFIFLTAGSPFFALGKETSNLFDPSLVSACCLPAFAFQCNMASAVLKEHNQLKRTFTSCIQIR